VTDPRGHAFGHERPAGRFAPAALATLPTDLTARRRAVATLLAADAQWRYAADLFNEGFYWEAHEAWEHFRHMLGRTTPEARFVQGLIHLAAACVKIREGKPTGVAKHTQRAREHLGGSGAAGEDDAADGPAMKVTAQALGLDLASLGAVVAELDAYHPECRQTSHFLVVKFLAAGLRMAR